MGFLSGLFRSRDAPRNSTSGSAYRFFMGNSTSGKRVNERPALCGKPVCGYATASGESPSENTDAGTVVDNFGK